jgi:hypothetical protein
MTVGCGLNIKRSAPKQKKNLTKRSNTESISRYYVLFMRNTEGETRTE